MQRRLRVTWPHFGRKHEAGTPGDDAHAADLVQEYKARIAVLGRLAGRQMPKLEFLRGALKTHPGGGATTSAITGLGRRASPRRSQRERRTNNLV